MWQHYLLVYGVIFAAHFLTYFIICGGYTLWVNFRDKRGIEKNFIHPKRPHPRQRRAEFGWSLIGLFIYAAIGLLVYVAWEAGYTQIYTDVSEYGWGYFILSIFIGLAIHDVYFYCQHWLLHRRWLYENIHAVHHRSYNPSPWAAYSFHPVESILEGLILPVVIFLVPMHIGAIVIFNAIQMTINGMGHTGVELFPKGFTRHPLTRWLTTSTHHSVHHSRVHCNYGIYTNFWDWLFGTNHPEYDAVFDKAAWSSENADADASVTNPRT